MKQIIATWDADFSGHSLEEEIIKTNKNGYRIITAIPVKVSFGKPVRVIIIMELP